MELLFYCLAYLGVAALDFYVSVRARRKGTEAASMLANCLVCAGGLSVFYLVCIVINNPHIALTASLISIALMDIMLIYLLSFIFAFVYANLKNSKIVTWLMRILMVWAVIDMANVLLDPAFNHFAEYSYLGENVFPHYMFTPKPPYFVHLAFCYVLILVSFVVLVRHALLIPRMYRGPYYQIFLWTLAVVALNGIYLYFFSKSSADLSIIIYGFWGTAIYMGAFVYGSRDALQSTCFTTVAASSQPTLVFDYRNQLFYLNDEAKRLFPALATDSAKSQVTYDEFMESLNLDKLPHFNDDKTRFYWTPDEESSTAENAFSYICDLQEIMDETGKCAARSLVFTNNTLSVDPLTSYLTEQYFSAHNADLTDYTKAPIAVAVCDLNQLGLLNNILGFERGDDAIRLQANVVRKHLPEGTIYVRLHDARLAAICYGLEQEIIKSRLAMANAELGESNDFNIRLRMDYAVSMVGAEGAASGSGGVVEAASRATSILKTRKLLDKGSGHSSTLDSLNQMLTECDGETEGHVQRTRILGDNLAFELGLSDYERDQLSLLCLYHDIGKVGIPTEILKKPSSLTDAEKEIMREHVQKGYRIARATPGLEIVAEPILHHHERWDGTGYPDGLEHEEIPVLSRIIAVVDSYDAMVSDRPYHKGISSAEACLEIKRCAGKQFDPYVVDAFVRVVSNEHAAAEVVAASEGSETPYRRDVIKNVEEATPSAQTSMISVVEYSRYSLDGDMRIVKVDGAFERLSGYTAYEVEHSVVTQDDLLFEEDREQYWEMVKAQLGQGGMAYLEHRLRRKDGTGRYVYCLGGKFGKGDSAHFELVVTDITDANSVRRQVNLARNRAMMSLRRLEESIQLDPMTSLLNQSAFKKACERELMMGDQHCVLAMIDIDNFKGFNDTYGHPKGDVLLQEFASALEAAAGERDLVGRMGGDEFAALLVFDNKASLAEIAERVETFWTGVKAEFHDDIETPSFSMGAAQLDLGDTDFAELYERADANLYAAKNAGKAQLRF